MDVGVRSSNDIYDPIGQVSRKIVDERWSPYSRGSNQSALAGWWLDPLQGSDFTFVSNI
jgi:hypothetical protein